MKGRKPGEAETEVEKLKVRQQTVEAEGAELLTSSSTTGKEPGDVCLVSGTIGSALSPPARKRLSLSDPRRAGVRGQEEDAVTAPQGGSSAGMWSRNVDTEVLT